MLQRTSPTRLLIVLAALVVTTIVIIGCASGGAADTTDSGFEAVDASNNDQVAVRGGDEVIDPPDSLKPRAAEGRGPRTLSADYYYLSLETISRIEGAVQTLQQEGFIDMRGFDTECALQMEHVVSFRNNGSSVQIGLAPPGDAPFEPPAGDAPLDDPSSGDNPLVNEPCNPPNFDYDNSGGYTDPNPDDAHTALVACPQIGADGNVTLVDCSPAAPDFDPSKDPRNIYPVEKEFDLTLINCSNPISDLCEFIFQPNFPSLPFDPAADPTQDDYYLAQLDCDAYPEVCEIQVDILAGGPYDPRVANDDDDGTPEPTEEPTEEPTDEPTAQPATLEPCFDSGNSKACIDDDFGHEGKYIHESPPDDPDNNNPLKQEGDAIEDTEGHLAAENPGKSYRCDVDRSIPGGTEPRRNGDVYVTPLVCTEQP